MLLTNHSVEATYRIFLEHSEVDAALPKKRGKGNAVARLDLVGDIIILKARILICT